MKSPILILSIFLLPNFLLAQNQIPDVEITSLINNEVDKEITINYNLSDKENDECQILLFVSENGGVTFPLEANATGDHGAGIQPGMNKQIKWKYGVAGMASAIKILAIDGGKFGINEMVSRVDSNRLRSQLEFFQGIRHRATGADHLQASKDSIENAFKNAGLVFQSFPFDFGTYKAHNIEGSLRGNFADEEYLLVGGHFDTVFDSPGADDNGSAIAGMLEVLRILKDYRFEKKIKFIGFDLEEEGLKGSLEYTRNSLHPDENCVGFLNLEMIGYYSNEPGSQSLPTGFELLFQSQLAQIIADSSRGNFINVVGNDGVSFPLQDSFETIGNRYVPELKIIGLSAPGNGAFTPDLLRSDHAPFWIANLPAVMITDGANFRNPHYHGPNDVLDFLNFTFMADVVKATIATIAELANPFHGNYDVAIVPSTVGVKETLKELIEVYPNPSENTLWIDTGNGENQIRNLTIFDMMGKEIYRLEKLNQSKINLSVKSLTAGQYFLQLIVNEEIISKKIIVK